MNYVQGTGKSLGVSVSVLAVMALAAIGSVTAQAQGYNVFYAFEQSATAPGSPSGVVAQGIDGNLYGYSDYGGNNPSCKVKKGCGTIYRITPCQGCTPAPPIVLYSFASYDNCGWGLTLGSDNNFYGACQTGGAGYGYAYQFIPNGTGPGTLTPLYTFCKSGPPCNDGAITTARPTEGRDGNYYLNTIAGGNPSCITVLSANGCGTIFQLVPPPQPGGNWTGNVLYSFPPNNNLVNPSGVLTLGSDGNLYGTTQGSAYNQRDLPTCPPNCGAIYSISTAGGQTPIVLHTFGGQNANPPDGATPTKGVIQGTDGNFYGSTEQGGANGLGFVYKMTADGEVKAFPPIPLSPFDYSFTVTDAANGVPRAMTQGSDSNFYGDARDCDDLGEDGCQYYKGYGGIFEITPEGTFSWVHEFGGQLDGANPDSKVSHTSGVIYGVTGLGGEFNDGVMYSVTLNDVEQPQFCRPQVLAGQAGVAIGILGQGFTSGSSVVEFGGVPAAITSITPTFITATIPTTAQTGPVTVTTGSITLNSLQTFYVLPNITGFGPPSGPVGTSVTITGTGWSQKSAQTIGVRFGSVNAKFTVNSSTQVTAIVPKGAVTAPIYITTAEGTAVSATDFTVTN
jgi:uncharacterized repeat protein (TIGR03803 family)